MVTLDPQIQAVLDHMAAQPQPPAPPGVEEMRAGARAGHAALSPAPVPMAELRELTVPTATGDVSVLVDVPRVADEPLPVLLYFHGGGLMLLDAEAFNPTCTQIARLADCIVVNVDYPRTPEHRFPEPLDASFGVYAWCREHAASFGGDPSRVGVAGDSAGGYLSTAICLDAKAAGIQQPTCQALVYPAVDWADRSESMITVDAFINEQMVAGLTAAYTDDVLHPRVSPLRAADHTGLAPALILAADHDPLRDQGRAYAALLRRSGVDVDYRSYEGTVHAFFTWGAAVDRANEAVADLAAWVSARFGG